MLASELDFDLPSHLIAQEPARPRDSARLLHLQSASKAISHRRIADLPMILRLGDLLVFNDSRVLRARLHGIKTHSGGRIEAVLLRECQTNLWRCLLRPSARIRPETALRFVSNDGAISLDAIAVERHEADWTLRFLPHDGADVRDILPFVGEIPLPPYIHRAAPESDYQTTFARLNRTPRAALDSAAAPTAGLHFTPQLLDDLRENGIDTAFVTLGVGPGTFAPVKTATVEEHRMHAEEWQIDAPTSERINAQKARGGRVIAVGTTACRVLESAADESGLVAPALGSTEIFIRPGHRFRCIDALLTNFHLPRSTLLALVAAVVEDRMEKEPSSRAPLTGLEVIRYAYRCAIDESYRFFSFGDAMLIE